MRAWFGFGDAVVLWREVCIDGWIQYVKEVFYRFYRATGNTTEMAEELLSTALF